MIFAIDPGSEQSGIVSWDGARIGCAEIMRNDSLLAMLRRSANELRGRTVAIERISCYGKRVGREVFRTCEWIGEFAEAAGVNGASVERIERREVVQHFGVTGKGRDAALVAVLKDRFGEKGTKANPGATYKLHSHCWQAFALAVFAKDRNRD